MVVEIEGTHSLKLDSRATEAGHSKVPVDPEGLFVSLPQAHD